MWFLLRGATAHCGLMALSFLTVLAGCGGQGQVERPNILFILVDDLGATDIGCFGSTYYETPNIDRLADQGMRFTTAYAACTVCSPTRASILTGKYPARLHITDWIEGHKRPWAQLKVPDWTMYLPHEEVTIAEALKAAGYATVHIGKWHLGREQYYPETQGFDRNIGGNHMGAPPSYFHPYERNGQRIETMPPGGMDGDYLTDRLTSEAIAWITEQKDNPWFMYLPYYAVHQPLMGKPEQVEHYKQKTDPRGVHGNPVYAAMIHSVDENVGRLMRTLEDLDLDDNTIVFFFSDNGGLIGNPDNPVTSNVPFRAGKGTEYEGGVREPCIVRWPGTVTPGSECDAPVMSIDFYNTILEMTGAPGDPIHETDGRSIVPLLTQSGTLDRDALFWHYPHYHSQGARPYSAVRLNGWRLIEYFEDGRMELYNLAEDIGETNNLVNDRPDKVTELHDRLKAWRDDVGAHYPVKNPEFDPARETQQGPR